MDRQEIALLPYRLRAVRVGIWTTALAVAALVIYALVPGSRVDNRGGYYTVVGAGVVGMAFVAVLPWRRLLQSALGIPMLYAWSVTDIFLISMGVAYTGGSHSELWVVYILTTLFFAASYPPSGQIALTAFTALAYNAAVVVVGDVDGSSMFIHTASLALMAMIGGFLSLELMRQINAQAEARSESERRASMLATVASAARAMSTFDPDLVLDIVAESALHLGFTASEICMFDGPTWSQTHHHGVDLESMQIPQPSESGLAGAVRKEKGTVVIDDYASWTSGILAVRKAGFRLSVGVPIWCGPDLVGVLIAGTQEPRERQASEIECLELLGAQAGAALSNARRYAEREAFEARLTHQAFHDALTGLPNRALFIDRLEHAVARTTRDGGEVGVLFMDLDRFKMINDSLGHDMGDLLLVQVGERLAPCLRPGDTLARYGGDEFTVLVEDSGTGEAAAVANRILEALSRPFSLGGREVFVSASIGISVTSATRPDSDPLREADLAMYRAKDRGRNQWQAFEAEMNHAALARLESETKLRRAVERNEFRLVYQPLVSMVTGQITGVEALARWRGDDGVAVSPSDFIPLAEDTGLIVPLGQWILEEACQQAVLWHRAGLPLAMHVNVSARQLDHPSLIADISKILTRSGLRPDRLVLEVTETVVMEDVESTIEVMHGIQALGVRMAMDDFGRGNTSLTHLKRFPLQVVKVDKSFVDGVHLSPQDQAVIRSIVLLAAEFGMQVTAEGIELVEQLDELRRLGIDTAQGFYLAEPVPAGAVPVLVEQRRKAAGLPSAVEGRTGTPIRH